MTASMSQQAGPASEGRASDAGWEAPYYRIRAAGFQVLFLVEPDEAIEEVCNVDAEVHLADGSRWSSTRIVGSPLCERYVRIRARRPRRT